MFNLLRIHQKTGSKSKNKVYSLSFVLEAKNENSEFKYLLFAKDHIVPVSKKGSNAHSNMQILCTDCNEFKSDKILSNETLRQLKQIHDSKKALRAMQYKEEMINVQIPEKTISGIQNPEQTFTLCCKPKSDLWNFLNELAAEKKISRRILVLNILNDYHADYLKNVQSKELPKKSSRLNKIIDFFKNIFKF